MNNTDLALMGFSYKTASIKRREAWTLSSTQLNNHYQLFKKMFSNHELLILSTCNRFEQYVMGNEAKAVLVKWLQYIRPSTKHYDDQSFYGAQGSAVVDHLFQVAAGLNSMVIGENQILGQMKASYKVAQYHESIHGPMHRLIEHALKVGKKVRAKTAINREKCSISSIACQLLEQELGCLYHKKVMLIGTGELAEQTMSLLKSKSVSSIIVANRNLTHAKQLAKKNDAEVINLGQIAHYLNQIDMIISCTSAPHYILKPHHFDLRQDDNKPNLVIIDLALPRDIHPQVGRLKKVQLYNLDQLQRLCKKNELKRLEAKKMCLEIISQEKGNYLKQGFIAQQPSAQFIPVNQAG